MKRELMTTTALIGAGMLVGLGVGQDANAAEPWSLSVGGYFATALSVQDEDDDPGNPAENKHDTVVATDGEIQFTAKTELDNGLKIAARIEYEAHNQGGGATIVDERWVRFTGGFGQLKIGSDDNAAYSMVYQAPVAAGAIGVNTPTWGIPQTGGNAIGSYTALYPAAGSDGNKIIYFTPRVNGFQLGLSWQPDGNADGSIDSPEATPGDNDAGDQENIFAVGANYVATHGDVDVVFSLGYTRGDDEASTAAATVFTITSTATITAATSPAVAREDRQQVSLSTQFGFAGFTIGASYLHDDGGRVGPFDLEGYDIGVTYGAGPWTVGAVYLTIDQERGAGARDDEVEAFAVNGSYDLAAGVNLYAGVKFYSFRDGAGDPGSENDAVFGIVGMGVSF